MQQIVTAFWGEGTSDYKVLPVLLERTISHVISHFGRNTFEVLSPREFPRSHIDGAGIEERYVDLAQKAYGTHFVAVHHDSDSPSEDDVLANQYNKGVDRVNNTPGERCSRFVPMIPIRETESWLLADPLALEKVVGGGGLSPDARRHLSPARVESINDPKAKLNLVINSMLALPRRRRIRSKTDIFLPPLAGEVSIETLQRVPSFRRFYDRIHYTLVDLGYAKPE